MDNSLLVQALPALIVLVLIIGAINYFAAKGAREEAKLGTGATPGFKGWLLVLVVILTLTPIRLLFGFVGYYRSPFIATIMRDFSISFYTEAILNAALLISALTTVAYMHGKKKEFKFMYYIQYFIGVIALPVNMLAMTVALHRRGLEAQFFDEEGIAAITGWIAMAAIGGLWAAYVARSRRVAVTFVN